MVGTTYHSVALNGTVLGSGVVHFKAHLGPEHQPNAKEKYLIY